MSISKREKILIIIVVLLALVGVYYLYYLKPTIEEINTLGDDNQTKELQLSVNEQKEDRIEQLEAENAEIMEQLAQYGDSIAQAFDQPPILVYLSDTLTDANAQKGTITFEYPELIGQIEHCAITIMLVSTYDDLKVVLDQFANAPYLIRVSSMRIEHYVEEVLAEDTGAGDTANGTAEGDTTAAANPETGETAEPLPPLIGTTLILDFYCLAGDIPEGTVYHFDAGSEFGGDIFY